MRVITIVSGVFLVLVGILFLTDMFSTIHTYLHIFDD
jgi:hypothetical protein